MPLKHGQILVTHRWLESTVRSLPNGYFELMTEQEIFRRKQEVVFELRMDTSFKLLSLLEAELRQDVEVALKRKWRDQVSRAYRDLCDQRRKEKDGRRLTRLQAGARLRVDDILDALRDVFRTERNRFHAFCSEAKGYFRFRHWYAHGRFFQVTPSVPRPDELAALFREFEKYVFGRIQVSASNVRDSSRFEVSTSAAP